MTRAEREEGKRLCEKATPGPWIPDDRGCLSEGPSSTWDVDANGRGVCRVYTFANKNQPQRRANSHFIAHARTAYPAALKEIDRLEAENAALREALLDVTPPHRKRGTCWCGIGRDIDTYGHDSSCERARDLLQTALEPLGRRVVDRAHALLEGRDV